MTAAPVLNETDSGPDEHDLSRITVAIGRRLFDFGLPHNVAVSVLADEVIEIVKNHQGCESIGEFDDTEREWTFAHALGDALDPAKSLAEAEVRDGDLLVIRETKTVLPATMVDELAARHDPAEYWPALWKEHGWSAAWFVTATVLSAASAALVPGLAETPRFGMFPVAAVGALGVGVLIFVCACVLPLRTAAAGQSAWLAAVAVPLIFTGSLYVVPNAHGFVALPMAMALVSMIAVMQLVISGVGRVFYTAVVTLTVLCAPAAAAAILTDSNPRAIGAILAVAAMMVVYRAPQVVITLSRLPVPNVPTAGEPLDDIEIQGGTSVEGVNALGNVVPTEEGMTQRVGRASQYQTGILFAAAVSAAIGCYVAADVTDGFYWQGMVFAFAVATALCLRGRTHHELVQAVALIGSGLLTASAVIVKTALFVDGWQVNGALLLIALTAVVLLCGLVAPAIGFSPVMRRRVEIGDYVAIAVIVPLACWIVGVFAYFRELQLG